MFKKYFLFINLALMGLFISIKSCQADNYYCRCITAEHKHGEDLDYDFEKVKIGMMDKRNDEELCIKNCEKAKSKDKKPFIGAMSPGVCKENLCSTNRRKYADGNRHITLFNK
ncbi:MAG: hypothetical protein K2W94_00115 [Alphaproteobacteria bacterium]|nr:hypothetical protein [Alphaproteobacteria bacterium]